MSGIDREMLNGKICKKKKLEIDVFSSLISR